MLREVLLFYLYSYLMAESGIVLFHFAANGLIDLGGKGHGLQLKYFVLNRLQTKGMHALQIVLGLNMFGMVQGL